MKKRRFLAALTAGFLMLAMALPVAMASETEETTEETKVQYSTEKQGKCGKDATWKLEGHTLTITGTGEIDAGSPWEFYKDSIHKVFLKGGITHIGAEAFAACNNLAYIDFGDSIKEIGYRAFYSCNSLKAIQVPDSFRKFDVECFLDCDNLQVVYCAGPMPSFRGSCLYTDHVVQVYFSAQVPWPYEYTSVLENNFGGRVKVDMGSPEALKEYWKDIDTKEPAETKPAETKPAETKPVETQPVETVPETTPTTVPPTTEATVPETQSVETEPVATEAVAIEPPSTAPVLELNPEDFHTPEPTEAPVQRQNPLEVLENLEIGIWVWVLIGFVAFTAILILALLIRMILHGGSHYDD